MIEESYPTGGEGNGDLTGGPGTPAGELRPFERVLAKHPTAAIKASVAASHETAGGGLAGYLHAYRRHWFLATSLGLICGAAAAAAVWLSATTSYTSSAVIQVASVPNDLIPTRDDNNANFELYKGTQMQLLKSDFVLIAALRNDRIASLELVKREEDPIRWLARSLQVDAPGNAEIIQVSLTTPDRIGGAAVVQAVVDAYLSEVVDKERIARQDRLAELKKLYDLKEGELRDKRTQLANLEKDLGKGDKGQLSPREQFLFNQYSSALTKLDRLRGELENVRFVQADNDAMLAALKAGRARPIAAEEIDNAVANDPQSNKLEADLADLDSGLSEARSKLRPGSSLDRAFTDRYARTRKGLEDQLAKRRQQLLEHLKPAKAGDRDILEAKAHDFKVQAERLDLKVKECEKEVDDLKKLTDLISTSSIEVVMKRAELDQLESTFSTISHELAHERLEHDSQARITNIQKAAPPAAPDRSSRLQNAISAGLFGFLAPVGLLLWWDVRARKINSVHDISHGLKLRVIGTVPYITDPAVSRIRPNSRRQRQTQICLDHSIDGIAAKLCLRRDLRNARVVLVSSATHGEGKSTLSIQLAKRLARTGARTLLVDFDMRKPTLHRVFDLPRGPGLSDFLRGDGEFAAMVNSTEIENLSILTAGSPFANSLGTLANGVTRSLFEKVREDYAFVVVDGSPILPVVDSLLASQHVDSVVLSIRRDVSQISRVQAACEQLSQFGVEEFVAVLTGSNEDLYYYDDEHQYATLADERHKPR